MKNLKRGKGIDDYLLNPKTPFFSSENKINFLQHIKKWKSIAFIEYKTLSDTKKLHFISLEKDSGFIAFEFKDSLEQLYVKKDAQSSIIATIVNKENIITINVDELAKAFKFSKIRVNEIQSLSDFIDLISGRLLINVASSMTMSTIMSSSEISRDSTTECITTKKITSQMTKQVSTKSVKSITIAPSGVTVTHTSIPIITSTNLPITSLNESAQTILTTEENKVIASTPQSEIPFSIESAGGSSHSGIIIGSLLGIGGIAGLIALGGYRYIQRYRRNNEVPGFELEEYVSTDSSRRSSNEKISTFSESTNLCTNVQKDSISQHSVWIYYFKY